MGFLLPLLPATRPRPSLCQLLAAPLLCPKPAQLLAFEKEGGLVGQKPLHRTRPQYPAWAEEQGIIGSVRLYFTVTPEGQVRANIRVTKTTGHPQLDQLGIDALKQWQFAPVPSSDEGKGEWGIITFNFSLAS